MDEAKRETEYPHEVYVLEGLNRRLTHDRMKRLISQRYYCSKENKMGGAPVT
jgi:hypothetical protein